MMRHMLLVALCGLASQMRAQSLSDRVGAIRDGDIFFRFASRAGVCGDGESYIRLNNSYIGSFNGRGRGECITGPVQVRLRKIDGGIARVDTWIGRVRERDGVNFGVVSAPAAASYLLQLGKAGMAPTGVIIAAVMADSARVWPDLLTIARDDRRSRSTRQDAAFWLSRFAASAIAGRPNDLMDDDDHVGEDDVKRHAVFVLSQLPHNEGVPAMLDVAKTNKTWSVRSSALFWLGQTMDSRALDLFENLLRK